MRAALGGTTNEIESVVDATVPCASLRQITPSKRDTDQTIRDIREQNAVIAALCDTEPTQ